ncbi:capreomycidine synthase [Saccharothrix sp. HUAS TT1]|uniref:capreomycidine synthase n=1 Tax=unclassified Saccharothrix TaxID=2593673 RepID=UPI00345C38C3
MVNLGSVAPALLEDWLRERYFTVPIDVSSSGVRNYSLGELSELVGLDDGELSRTVFRDSPGVGCEGLREALAARYAPGAAGRVMVTHGSSEAIFLALAALLEPGDEVVVLAPAYQSLSSIAEALGATLKVWRLRPENDFRPDPRELRALLDARTKAVIVNFPHNPTGTTLDRPAYRELLELVSAHGCHLLWDGAFSDLVYDAPSLPDPTTELERCVSFGTLSKAYGLPGLRVGWCFAPPELLTGMARIRDYLTISTSPLTELIATRVVENADRVIGPLLRTAAANREAFLTWVAENADIVACAPPQGGVSAFPQLFGVPAVDALCEDLAVDRGVLVVPGSCFGHPDHIRIGFGGDRTEFDAGLTAIAEAIRAGGANRVRRVRDILSPG